MTAITNNPQRKIFIRNFLIPYNTVNNIPNYERRENSELGRRRSPPKLFCISKTKNYRLSISSQKCKRDTLFFNGTSLIAKGTESKLCPLKLRTPSKNPFIGTKLKVFAKQRRNVASVGKYRSSECSTVCPLILTKKCCELIETKQMLNIKLLNNMRNHTNSIKAYNLPLVTESGKFKKLLKPMFKEIKIIKNINKTEESIDNNKLMDALPSFCNSKSDLIKATENEDPKKEKKMKHYNLIMNVMKPMFFFNTKKEDGEPDLSTPCFIDSFRKTSSHDDVFVNKMDLLNKALV